MITVICPFSGYKYIVKLKQMGGYFCLNGKKMGLPLCMEEDLLSSEMCSIEEFIINQRHIPFFNSKDSCLIRKVNKYMCNVENCNNLDEFCILTEHDFSCEHRMKNVIFGHTFENHDSDDFIQHCFNAITLGQMFMDDFGLIQGSNTIDRDGRFHSPSIPVGNWQTDL